MIPNQLLQASSQPQQISPNQIQATHQHLSDFQDDLKKLIQLPDNELNLKNIYGAASDSIMKNKLSNGKRGMTPMIVASELSGPDFPKAGPNGEPPGSQQLRQFLLNHFNKSTQLQAMLTAKHGAPMQESAQPQAQQQQQQQLPQGLSTPQPNNALMSGGM